jgi:hypothetical protein
MNEQYKAGYKNGYYSLPWDVEGMKNADFVQGRRDGYEAKENLTAGYQYQQFTDAEAQANRQLEKQNLESLNIDSMTLPNTVKNAELLNIENTLTDNVPAQTNLIQNNADKIDIAPQSGVLPINGENIQMPTNQVSDYTNSIGNTASNFIDSLSSAYKDGYNDAMNFLSVDYKRHTFLMVGSVVLEPDENYRKNYYAGYIQAQKDYADNVNNGSIKNVVDDSEIAREEMSTLGKNDFNSGKGLRDSSDSEINVLFYQDYYNSYLQTMSTNRTQKQAEAINKASNTTIETNLNNTNVSTDSGSSKNGLMILALVAIVAFFFYE